MNMAGLPDHDIIEVEGPLQNIEDDEEGLSIFVVGEAGVGKSTLVKPLQNIGDNEEGLSIFVVGEAGVGKSTLVNSFLGQRIAEVTHGTQTSQHEPVTKYTGIVHNTNVTVYDTRGLNDPTLDDKKLIKSFQDVVCDDLVDIVLICHRMFGKFSKSSIHFVKLLAQYFKKRSNIWERCVFVLTQANTHNLEDECEVEDEDAVKAEVALKMAGIMAQSCLDFQDYLHESGIPDDTLSQIPVCASGNKKPALPVTEDWILTFINICRRRCPSSTVKAFMEIEKKRRSTTKTIAGKIAIPGLGEAIGFTVGNFVAWNEKKKLRETLN